MASSAQLCYLQINHGDRRLTKCMWIIKETLGSNSSPEFARLFLYLSYSWGCACEQMDLCSVCLAKLQNFPTLLSTRAGGEALIQAKWKIGVLLSVLKSSCFAQPTESLVQFWLANNQLKNWKIKEKTGPLQLSSRLLQCVQQDGFSHTNPGHWAGIIQVTHSFLLFVFQNKSILPLKTTAFSVLACRNPLSEHGQTF